MSAESTIGTVIEIEEISNTDNEYTFRYVIEFTDNYGKLIVFNSLSGGSSSDFSQDEKIEVLFDPNNSQNARLSNFVELWLGDIGLAIYGFLFVLSALGVLFFRKKS